MNTLIKILSHYDSLPLKSIEKVAFSHRSDTKFVFSSLMLPQILNSLNGNYYVLDIKGIRGFRYSTIYYDTPNLDMYLDHIRGKLNRYKFRYRSYETTHESFFEVKFKSNTGVTSKWRIPAKGPLFELTDSDRRFLNKYLPYSLEKLTPVLKTSFNRITFVDKLFNQRVTFDSDLDFSNLQKGGGNKSYSRLAVIEIKNERSKTKNGLQTILREKGIRPDGFSKYCLGIALTREISQKHGTLKPKMLKINKLLNQSNS